MCNVAGDRVAPAERSAHVIETRANDFAGCGKADHEIAVKTQRQVEAGQHVEVIGAFVAVRCADIGRAVVVGPQIDCRCTARVLVGPVRLHADVTGQPCRAEIGIDVGLRIGRHDLFPDGVGLDHHIAIGIGHKIVDPCIDQLDRIVADHRAEAQIAEIGGSFTCVFRDRYRDRAVGIFGKAQEVFLGCQRFGTGGVIPASLDRTERAAVQFTFHLDVELPQFVLDLAVVVITVLPAGDGGPVGSDLGAAPTLRTGQEYLIVIAVVQFMRERGAARCARKSDGVGRPIAKPSGTGISLDHQFVTVRARVAYVGSGVPAIVTLPGIVPAKGIELGVTLECIVAQHALDVGEGTIGDQPVGNRIAIFERSAAPVERQFDAALDLVVLEVRIEPVKRRGEVG